MTRTPLAVSPLSEAKRPVSSPLTRHYFCGAWDEGWGPTKAWGVKEATRKGHLEECGNWGAASRCSLTREVWIDWWYENVGPRGRGLNYR